MNHETDLDEVEIDLIVQAVMDKLEEREAARQMAARVIKRVLQTQKEEMELRPKAESYDVTSPSDSSNVGLSDRADSRP